MGAAFEAGTLRGFAFFAAWCQPNDFSFARPYTANLYGTIAM
jgi:hypothetical protein